MPTPDVTLGIATTTLPEQALVSGSSFCVLVQPPVAGISLEVQVVNHGSGILYVRPGASCSVKDGAAQPIGPGMWGTAIAYAGWGNLLSFATAATDGVFTVTRR